MRHELKTILRKTTKFRRGNVLKKGMEGLNAAGCERKALERVKSGKEGEKKSTEMNKNSLL